MSHVSLRFFPMLLPMPLHMSPMPSPGRKWSRRKIQVYCVYQLLIIRRVPQICDSLDYLEKVCNDVFTRVSNRVSENHQKLQSINERVNLAQAKIDKLKGSNKVRSFHLYKCLS